LRGLWDHEQPLAPSLLRSALQLVGGFLAAMALGMIGLGVLGVVRGEYVTAFFLVTAGIALPFAIWLGLKMLADILTVLNRSYDRLDALEERFSSITNAPRLPPQAPKNLEARPLRAGERASDDGPNYPEGD
jgi:hypothetical protein